MKKDNIYGFDYKQEIKEYTALCKNKRNRKYKIIWIGKNI